MYKKIKRRNNQFTLPIVCAVVLFGVLFFAPTVATAQDAQRQAERAQQQAERSKDKSQQDNLFGKSNGGYECGKGSNVVKTRINFGCLGPSSPHNISPIEDMLYAFVRFLSYGVGIVLIGSMIWAGVQYSTSEGNPETTQAAKNRIRDAVIGLFIYIFAFSLVQYLVPGGLFN